MGLNLDLVECRCGWLVGRDSGSRSATLKRPRCMYVHVRLSQSMQDGYSTVEEGMYDILGYSVVPLRGCMQVVMGVGGLRGVGVVR